MDIREALQDLDPTDDTQWTEDGLPKVDAVAQVMGSTITRKQITDAAPSFTRTNPRFEAPKASDAPAAEPETQEPPAPPAPTPPPAPPAPVAPKAPPAPQGDVEDEPYDPDRPQQTAPPPNRRRPQPMTMAERDEFNAQLGEEIRELETEMRDLDVSLADMQREKDQIAKLHAQKIAQLKLVQPHHEQQQQENIQTYLRRSRETRAARANATKEFLGGIKAKELLEAINPASKLDARMKARRIPRPLMTGGGPGA